MSERKQWFIANGLAGVTLAAATGSVRHRNRLCGMQLAGPHSRGRDRRAVRFRGDVAPGRARCRQSWPDRGEASPVGWPTFRAFALRGHT